MTAETSLLVGPSKVADEPGRYESLGFESYRRTIVETLAAGWRFAGMSVAADGGWVRTLLVAAGGETRLVSVAVEAGAAPSLVDLVPAAAWDEREAADLHGIAFAGHEPLRPLVNHPELDRWTVPVRGDDAYQVAVGPIHAGIIESGHFRFHLVGERILHLDAQLFYKHRGLEKAAEGVGLELAGEYLARSCAACSVTNGVAYAHAWEQALGLAPESELARVRTVLLELERLWSHLNDIAAICAGVGLAAGNNHFAALTERARRLNAVLTGHRFLAGAVRVGGSDLVVARDAVRAARAELAALREAATLGWCALIFNKSFMGRLDGVGEVSAEQARRLGTVGPAARAAGIAEDARSGSRTLAYDGFQPVTPERTTGDVRARLEQRALELWQALDILDGLLGRPLGPAAAEPSGTPMRIGIGVVESPRGATSCVVERDASFRDRDIRGGRRRRDGRGDHDDGRGLAVGRVRLRTGSFANWPSVAHAAVGNILPDFPLINKSFELCYACVDR